MGFAASALLATAGLATCAWLWFIDAGPGTVDAVFAGAPFLLGVALAASSREDRRQFVARLFAAALMLPLLLAMWVGTTAAGPAAPATGPLIVAGVAAACALLAAWAALLLFAARISTRIDPAPSVAPVTIDRLHSRIASLSARGWPLQARDAGDHALDVHLDVAHDGTRWHTVRLALDAARHEVRVREDLGAAGARPQDASEASMRGVGDPYFDPARPPARWMSGRVRQATMIEPALLDALSRSPAIRAGGPTLPEGDPAILGTMSPEARGEHMVSLLAAAVTSAGWAWQPVLIDRQRD